MKRKCNVRGLSRQAVALFMSMTMAVSMITAPAIAEEESTVVSLIKTATTLEMTSVKNEYGDDYIVDYPFTISEELKASVAEGKDYQLEVSVTVNNHEFVTETPEIAIYAMNGVYGEWNQTQTSLVSGTQTYELSLDLSAYESLGMLGMRFVAYDDAASVNFTINYAQVREIDSASGATETVATLINAPITEQGLTIDNEWGNDYIVDKVFAIPDAVHGAVAAGEALKLKVSVTVHSHECVTGSPEVVIYAMDANDANWKQANTVLLAGENTYELSLNLADYTSLGMLGMRFATFDEGANISYTINSAEVVKGVTIVDDGSLAILADPGTNKSGIVINNPYGNDMIVDNPFTLPSNLTYGLGGFTSLALEVGVTVTNYTYTPVENEEETTESETEENGEEKIVGPSVVIYAQNSQYTMWEQEDEALTDTPQTFTLVLDLAPFIEEGTLSVVGLRICGCDLGTTVNYTIDYARIVGEGEPFEIGEDTVELKYKLTGERKDVAYKDTAVGQHGKLSVAPVEGYAAPTIVDKNGEAYQLRGASSHGLSWFPKYVNKDAYQTFRDEWGMNMVRIAVYAREGDYAYVNGEEAEAYNDQIIQTGVQAASELGMYVIIDWHVLNYNPNDDYEKAAAFFTKYATMYKDYDNVIFEICNEPVGTEWYNGTENDIYTYGTKMTKLIRDCGSNAIVICGTNNYSSEIDKVAEKPLDDENVMYACHFYSASHYDEPQKKLTDALAEGVPVFVSEFGICTASGDGMYDIENADEWLDICDENNVSYACWAMSNSQESAAFFKTDCWNYTSWTEDELTTTSKYLINRYRDREAELEKNTEVECEHTNTIIKGAKAATYEDEGYTGDTYCEDCGEKLESGATIPKLVVSDKNETTNSNDKITVEHVTSSTDKSTTNGPKKETIFKHKKTGAKYKVTTSTKGSATVEYVAPAKKNAKNIVIPASVKINGVKYKVTSIEKNAFKNCKSLKSVTIGKNVKKIGKKAFYGCSNLETIIIKTTKLNEKNIGKKAFAKTDKKVTVKLSKKLYKKYKKVLVKKGISKKATFKKMK